LQTNNLQTNSSGDLSVSKIVVKIGGSLLLRPDLANALRRLITERFADAQVNLVVGGGAMIDAFRQLDSIHSLDPVEIHWQCVTALRHTGEIVARLLPDCVIIDSIESYNLHRQLQRRAGWFVVIPEVFYHRDSGDSLPCDWTTTSDSIAALLAKKIDAEKLILLKSCDVPRNIDLHEAAQLNIVDPVLPSTIDTRLVEIIQLP
jgi:aspartokinase-like uncharacterized kinase